MRLTDKSVASLRPKARRYEIWESGRKGFGLRVAPTGRKSWLYMYRFGGKARRMTLGTYPEMTLATARLRYAQARHLRDSGIDPGKRAAEERAARRNAETVEELVAEYLERYARPRKRSAAEDERALTKDVLPRWGKRKAKDITRRDVIQLLDAIVDRGAPIQANRTLAVVRKMFNFALARDIVDATPAALVKAPAKERQRDRVLTAEELKAFWTGLDDAGMSRPLALALRLQLATAQRKGEVIGAAAEEFDLAVAVWAIPAARAKNGRAHRVPLSPMACALVAEAMALAGDSGWLFPSPRGDKPVSPRALNTALARALPDLGLENLTPHDLRRSAASGMTALGISRLVVAKILNHADSSVTAVYDRFEYEEPKRHALEAWAGHLDALLTDQPEDKVVPLYGS